MTVVGIERKSFQKENERVEFARVTLLQDLIEPYGEGQSADVVNVSLDKIQGLNIGDEVEVSYNKYGKVRRFEVIKNGNNI